MINACHDRHLLPFRYEIAEKTQTTAFSLDLLIRTSTDTIGAQKQADGCLLLGGVILKLQQELEQRLRDKGVRPTRQRMEIGELLLANPRHMSADQILQELREKGSRLSKATVYNTLNLLSKEGIVREIAVDPERMVYDSTSHPHHHFYNVDTGELTDIDQETVQITGLPELPHGTIEQDIEIIVRVRNNA